MPMECQWGAFGAWWTLGGGTRRAAWTRAPRGSCRPQRARQKNLEGFRFKSQRRWRAALVRGRTGQGGERRCPGLGQPPRAGMDEPFRIEVKIRRIGLVRMRVAPSCGMGWGGPSGTAANGGGRSSPGQTPGRVFGLPRCWDAIAHRRADQRARRVIAPAPRRLRLWRARRVGPVREPARGRDRGS